MELPQEIEVWYTLPAVRRELARALVATGLTQRDVARKLGVTDAAISQYLANKRGTAFEYPVPVARAMTAAANRVAATSDEAVIRAEIQHLCDLMKEHKVICEIHKKHSSVKEGCSSCFE